MKYLLAFVTVVVGGVVWAQVGFGWAIAAFLVTSFVAGVSINAIEKSELREAVGGRMKFERLENVDEETYRRAAIIRGLQSDYALLNAEAAPLLAEAQEMKRIREQLQALGSDVDWDLCDQIKQDTGVPDTSFNSRPNDED